MTKIYSIVTYNIAAYCCFQLEGRLKRKEPEEQKIKEEVDEKVQVKFQEFLIYCYHTHGVKMDILTDIDVKFQYTCTNVQFAIFVSILEQRTCELAG